MSKTKRIDISAEAMEMAVQIDLIPETGVYDTVKSIPLSMNDPSAHVMEYMSYLLWISGVLTLKILLGRIIFVSGDIKERRNGTLNVADLVIVS